MQTGTHFEKYFANAGEFVNLELTLARIEAACRALSPSFGGIRVVHIAGTNGKGSTSYFIAQLLEQAGCKTMLFTSPHTTTICERIKYRLTDIPTLAFDSLFDSLNLLVAKYKLSFFETLFLMVIKFCMEVRPDFLILETGLGGRYDATNADIYPAKTPVITSISQDHKDILGAKISDILQEKLAIARDNSPVFVANNPDFIMSKCREALPNAEIITPTANNVEFAKVIYNEPYCYNYANAHNIVSWLLGRDAGFSLLKLPPCRQEWFGNVMLDGAHNISGLLSLVKSFKNRTLKFAIVSLTADRDTKRYLSLLSKWVSNIILTTIPNNQRSITAVTAADLPCEFVENPTDALKYAKARIKASEMLLITGSLYLCAYLRPYLIGQKR